MRETSKDGLSFLLRYGVAAGRKSMNIGSGASAFIVSVVGLLAGSAPAVSMHVDGHPATQPGKVVWEILAKQEEREE